jgi:hypothetical protein
MTKCGEIKIKCYFGYVIVSTGNSMESTLNNKNTLKYSLKQSYILALTSKAQRLVQSITSTRKNKE